MLADRHARPPPLPAILARPGAIEQAAEHSEHDGVTTRHIRKDNVLSKKIETATA
jgi:hypothetical protein